MQEKALVLGHIGLVRSLGREGISVTLAKESPFTFERFSRYCREYLSLPNLDKEKEKAIEILEEYGSSQEHKPVAFFNSESDVLLFSRYREQLSKYYHIILAPDCLINKLVDKSKFAQLAAEYNLPVPKNFAPHSKEEFFHTAERIGYPCILKPLRQRMWHNTKVIAALGGVRKALMVDSKHDLEQILNILPLTNGSVIVQEYIPGNDQLHFDFHVYIDTEGTPKAYLVGHKIRIYPIHFGMGCYTHYTENPSVVEICLETLRKIGYTGAANINLKRHAETGKYFILEINPRFSLWVIIDLACGVNLPLLQYREALGLDLPNLRPSGGSRRWLYFRRDFNSMLAYRKTGEITLSQWFKSFFSFRGRIEFHIFAWDDPLPFFGSCLMNVNNFTKRIFLFFKRRLSKFK